MIHFKLINSVILAGSIMLCTSASAFDLDEMSDTQKDQFGEQVREYILNNPEVITEALQIYEEHIKNQEARETAILVSDNLEVIQNDGYSWVGGNPNGDITLVEFLDYKCGFCRKAHDEVADLVETDGNIKLVVKEYPILGDDSILSAHAAIATLQSLGPDAYKKMHDQLIAHDGPITAEAILFLANKAGIDGDAILDGINNQTVMDHIKETRELGVKLGIDGTPTFVFNDLLVRGYVPTDDMVQLIAKLRADTQ